MDKYLFLDIDGVLNSDEYYVESYKHKNGKISENYRFYPEETSIYQDDIDRTCVDIIGRICRETGATVILSSSWRSDERCFDEFEKLGINIGGRTPYLESRHRGSEISRFLETHPCESYCILDDDTDILDEQKDCFVNIDYHFGVTNYDADKAIDILGKVI